MKIPKNLSSIIVVSSIKYTREELQLFQETVCRQVGLNTLSAVLDKTEYTNSSLETYLRNIAEGNPNTAPGFYMPHISEGSKQFHAQLYHALYIVTLEDLPLLLRDDPDIVPAIKWRIKIGK